MDFPYTGLVAAPFTPLQQDGAVALQLVESYAAQLADTGVTAVFVNGTTGEGVLSLTAGERRDLAAAWAKHKATENNIEWRFVLP